jgi:hypothetical protein
MLLLALRWLAMKDLMHISASSYDIFLALELSVGFRSMMRRELQLQVLIFFGCISD